MLKGELAGLAVRIWAQVKLVVLQILNFKVVLWIRNRIGSGFDGVTGSGSRSGKMTHNEKKLLNVIF
jgi:hypothetical protein